MLCYLFFGVKYVGSNWNSKLLVVGAVLFLVAYQNRPSMVLTILAVAFSVFAAWWVWSNVIEKNKRRKRRIVNLNSAVERLGGVPESNVDDFMLDSTYVLVVAALEKEILRRASYEAVLPHLNVLARKRKQLLFEDDYGRQIKEKWVEELRYFVREVFFEELNSKLFDIDFEGGMQANILDFNDKYIVAEWVENVDLMVMERADLCEDEDEIFDEFMSGHEYEHYVAGLIRKLGWSANVTAGSGDHGADVIVENNSIRLAVQCKFYTGAVGNNSVQEAFSAKSYYDCQYACVVCNSTYTPAAKRAASKLGVALLHHAEIKNYLDTIN